MRVWVVLRLCLAQCGPWQCYDAALYHCHHLASQSPPVARHHMTDYLSLTTDNCSLAFPANTSPAPAPTLTLHMFPVTSPSPAQPCPPFQPKTEINKTKLFPGKLFYHPLGGGNFPTICYPTVTVQSWVILRMSQFS